MHDITGVLSATGTGTLEPLELCTGCVQYINVLDCTNVYSKSYTVSQSGIH